jgi:hypothetical protein
LRSSSVTALCPILLGFAAHRCTSRILHLEPVPRATGAVLAAKLKEKDEESPYADESPEEQIARIEVGQRIADYLQFNGFKNLKEAQERGWGELSPLRARSDHRSEEKH